MIGLEALASALPGLSGALGGGGTKNTLSQSSNVSIANNPTIANLFGEGGSIAPNVSGSASGTPSSSASSGSDGYGFLPGGSPSVPYRPNTGYVYGPQGQPIGLASTGAGDSMLPLLLVGGAALLFMFNND